MTGILNGSAYGWIKSYLDDECTVVFFSDTGCTFITGGINEDDDNSPMQPTNGAIQSWLVDCN
jgi:hypothetical protein